MPRLANSFFIAGILSRGGNFRRYFNSSNKVFTAPSRAMYHSPLASAPEGLAIVLECSRVCLSWAQIWAQTQVGEKFEAGNLLKGMVGRDGIEPPTPGFSVLDLHRRHRSPSQLLAISKAHRRRSAMLRPI